MTAQHVASRIVDLVGGGVRFALLSDARGVRVLHWGSAEVDDLEALAASSLPAVTFSSFDAPRILSVLPVESDGWSGAPALAWHRAGTSSAPQPDVVGIDEFEVPGGGGVVVRFADGIARVAIDLRIQLDRFGVLTASLAVTSTASARALPLDLVAARIVLPLPERAAEIVDHTGRWTGERAPQRQDVVDGSHSRAVRRGRPGHDAPFLTMVGTPGFGFRSGELWAAHLAWSGNHEVHVERLPEGAGVHRSVLVVGELLAPGEVRLRANDRYESPELVATWSEDGIDGASARLHAYARNLAAHPSTPRPLVLNTWEAVYFDHDSAKLTELAEVAARVGVERFVLDDGWFPARHSDRAGLGDWIVDEESWPDGLRPLSDRVHELGMEFGLWFEPEMVNLDSDLARIHPDWILGSREEWRHQLVLDLGNPAVYAHLLEKMSTVIAEAKVDFIKWDHNRELHAPVSSYLGRASVGSQTRAVYALMDELRERHPGLEIEACASGGARADLGALSHAQRVWASDSNDPIERQLIQRWTGTLLPPEVTGSHVGPPRAHTTHREASLSFRMLTALFGHAGIEWDVTECTEEELEALTRWTALYRELRPLLHTGITVRADSTDTGELLHGVVSEDASHAVFAWIRTATSTRAFTPRTAIPGLDPTRRYEVRVRDDLGEASRHQITDPAWFLAARAGEPFVVSGSLLTREGLPLPLLDPGAGLLLELRAADPTPRPRRRARASAAGL
ncbi:alpha-galactosidase [Salinibacterium sp. ZJ70]|uniref:alpha-galactosidase n=1 Tax=Salinibacterium sp. ZJ70 TaxID=2708084 RepID=UPI001421E7F4|nr:alpha-galactosidase [Salinibacterium sp. ZJ70]